MLPPIVIPLSIFLIVGCKDIVDQLLLHQSLDPTSYRCEVLLSIAANLPCTQVILGSSTAMITTNCFETHNALIPLVRTSSITDAFILARMFCLQLLSLQSRVLVVVILVIIVLSNCHQNFLLRLPLMVD